MFGLLLAFAVEAGWMLWFRFHVGCHVLLWKTLLACFAVAWRHRGVEISDIVWCWFCVEMEASLRCWFCNVAAFTQSLIHACVICLSRSWGEVPAGRPSGVGERGRVPSELQESQDADERVVLNCPGLDLAHRRLVQSERRYGTEPRLHGCSCKAFSWDEKNNFWSLY